MYRTALLLALLLPAAAFGFDVPAFTPNVVDVSGVLSGNETQELNATIAKIRQESHVLAAVLIVPSIQPDSIEQAAEEVFRTWQLGNQGADNGLLILVAMNDRRMRIEVGYGLEGVIPDVMANRIIQGTLVPNFREQRYAAGLAAALERCGALAAQGQAFDVETATPGIATTQDRPWLRKIVWPVTIWIVLIVVVPLVLRLAAAHRMGRAHDGARPGVWQIINPTGASLFLTLFLLVNPGVFFVIFMHQGWAIFTPLLIGFAYLFLTAVNWPYICILRGRSPVSAGFKLKAGRWMAVDGFGSGSSSRSGSSGSSSRSSSSGSSSSSSGGGRSGGGGASGSW